MKISINKKLRIGLIAILVLVISGVSFLLYRGVKYPGFREEKITLYSYNNSATVDYKVFLKDNELYTSSYLDEDQIYITEFVDYVDTTFRYEFSGDEAESLRGDYNIVAKVQGYNVDRDDNIIIIWERDFTLIPTTAFTIDGESKTIEEILKISLTNYNDFVTRIVEASKINCSTRLNIIMNVNIEGDTGVGPIEETITPSLTIPLNTSMFEITGNREIEQPGAIEETKLVQISVNRNKAILYGVLIGVLAIGVAFLIFFTEGASNKDPYEKTLRQIFKKHGDRFVALNSEVAATSEDINLVKSMDDLVRIADEIGKPIMYKYSANYKDINRFYVTDEDEIYMLDLRLMIDKEKSSRTIVTSKR